MQAAIIGVQKASDEPAPAMMATISQKSTKRAVGPSSRPSGSDGNRC
jgi:hypothetical protein